MIFFTSKLVMPFINTYNSCNTVSEIYNNQFYKTYSNKDYGCGNNSYGHLGTGLYSGVIHIPQKVLIEEKIKDIKSDYNQTYFITFDNEVYACGNNHDGYLGIGSDSDFELIPQKVLIEEKIKDIIALKYNQTYFITIDDECYACGNNACGQLGIGSYDKVVYIPQKVLIEEKIKDIKLIYYRTYFITNNNKVYACGDNEYGHLGIGLYDKVVCIPQKVLIKEKIKDTKLEYNHTYFITFDNEVYACGKNEYGQLGVGSRYKVLRIPQKVLLEEKIKDIESSWHRTYFITIDNKFYACGNNEYGHLGIGSYDKVVRIPQKVLIKEKIKDIKSNYDQTYFILINNKVYACGGNKYGQLGVGSYDKVVYIPQKVLLEEKIKSIESSWHRTYFITIDNKVYACGGNKYGQLGVGSRYKVLRIPQKVLIEEKITCIHIDKYYMYITTVDNNYYACGDNYYNGRLRVASYDKVIYIPQKVLLDKKSVFINIYMPNAV